MSDDREADEVNRDVATAVGLLALTDLTLHEAADRADVTQWQVEAALEDTDLADQLGLDFDGDVRDEIDRVLEDSS